MTIVIDNRVFKSLVGVIISFLLGFSCYTFYGHYFSDEVAYCFYWVNFSVFIIAILQVLKGLVLVKKIKQLINLTCSLFFFIGVLQCLEVYHISIDSFYWGIFVFLHTITTLLIYKYGKC